MKRYCLTNGEFKVPDYPNTISISSSLTSAYEITDRGMIGLDVLQMKWWSAISIPDGRQLLVMKRGSVKAAVRIIGEKQSIS